MLINSIMKVSAKVGKQMFIHAPELLIAGGIITGTAATVMGVRAGSKMTAVACSVNMKKEASNEIKKVLDEGDVIITDDDGTVYDIEKWELERKAINKELLKSTVINFSPVLGLSLVSGLMILSGFKIIYARMAFATAAAVSIDYNFRKYRERVIEAEGEDADFCYKTGATMSKVEREIVNEETGEIKKKKVKEPVLGEETVTPLDYSVNYLREASWLSDYQDMSMIMKDILMIQDSANMLLKHRWFMTWNDVRQMLHLSQTTAGQFVGWTVDPKTGDCKVDLRPRIVFDEKLGHDTIILDPNLDGLMADRIDEICEKRKVGIAL